MEKPGILARVADENRKFFLKNCIEADTPRMEATVYPEGLDVKSDLPYAEGNALPAPLAVDSAAEGMAFCCSDRTLDIYTPENAKAEEIFLLIHGGAFVYGCKELDKEFGMHLSLRSKIAVANVNYRLMPSTDLKGQLQDIFYAIEFLCKMGYKRFHTIGDSAGGYLCLLVAILINSKEARKACGIEDLSYEISCPSTSPICGDHKETPRKFAGIYFDPKKEMPSFIYDLTEAAKLYGCPPTVMTTGDTDMMLKQNLRLLKKLTAIGIPVDYYCAESAEDRVMHHVYSIAHPTWPESIRCIDMTCKAAGV
ncbi:MAG: alpha/beta hydrolase [Clostridiales bacterium]|nr:alpha/beta hydrolase [Clostridiales bacterium]